MWKRIPASDRRVTKMAAKELLNGPRLSAAHAHADLPDTPGLYAVFAGRRAQRQLGLPRVRKSRPIYVGKAEKSLLTRDGRTHFTAGRTGQSTLRRSIAALLHEQLNLVAQPRNPDKPERFHAFGLDPSSEPALQRWMGKRLKITTWTKPDGVDLSEVERALLARWTPPLNLQDNPKKWADLSKRRKAMADEAARRS